MNSLIRLTKEITLEDIETGKVSYAEAYQAQIEEWILKPCHKLGSKDDKNTNYGIAILALLILFFEHHAQYLEDQDSERKSGKFFKKGFSAFKEYLVSNNSNHNISKMTNDDIDAFWKFSRNGLFHSMAIKDKFLIDSINLCRDSSFSFYSPLNVWLINPWNLTKELSGYVAYYIEIMAQNDSIRTNFESSFERLVVNPMMQFL